MRILIMGLGSIGSMLAGYLVENNEVYGVGRAWHINAIRERGYLLMRILFKSEEKKVKLAGVSSSISDFQDQLFDCIFVCVKAYDVRNALRELVDNNVKGTCYVFIQNGIGIADIAKELLGDANIIRAVTNNGANIPEPGIVNHAGLGETFVGGMYGSEKEYWARRVSESLESVGLLAKYVDNIRYYLYLKLTINATINPLTAILRIRNKGVAEISELREIIAGVCREIEEVARAEGILLKNTFKTVLSVAKRTGKNISSMLQDILRGRRTEIDFINGAIVKLGRKHGIATPFNDMLYKLVKALEKAKSYEA
ncbi:MAG: ketopantoate reductase family protein [Candidatus Njordarchaeales archaeon]